MPMALRKVLKRMHYPLEVMLVCVRWYAAYPLSLRHIEEMMQERGVFVDHATIYRWTSKIVPILAAWMYLYRAVDRDGHTIDCVLRGSPRPRSGSAVSGARHRSTRCAGEDHDRQERRQHGSH